MTTVYISQFDGGVVNDPRHTDTNVCRYCAHFDAFTNKRKLTPYRSFETGDSSAATQQIRNFLFLSGTTYGLGTDPGTGRIQTFTRTTYTGATWTATSVGYVAGVSITDAEVPVFIAYQGLIYGLRSSRYVWRFTPDSALNNAVADLTTYTTSAPALVHSKDDILYIPYDNKIAKNNAGTWTVAALTLPTNMVITSICEYGNYLAIGCRQSDGQKSRVYLWDRDSTLTTLSESIDWGEGDLMVLEQLEGYLIGVSAPSVNSFANNYFQTRTTFRYYDGGRLVKFAELRGPNDGSFAANFFQLKQVINNRLYFGATLGLGSTGYSGIWSVGRNSEGVPFGVTLSHFLDSSGTMAGNISFFFVADYLFTTYISNAIYYTFKTDDATTYSNTSVFETTINSGMALQDRPQLKQLESVGANYESLPVAGQVVVKYKVDGGSWITVFTETADGVVYTEPFTQSAAAQFTRGKELEFRIESTGGCEITGLTYKYKVVPSNI